MEQPNNFATGLVERAKLSQSANLHKDQRGYAERQPESENINGCWGGYKISILKSPRGTKLETMPGLLNEGYKKENCTEWTVK